MNCVLWLFNRLNFQGNHSTGRTEFIYQLILSTILPVSWGPISIGGCGQGAIYFDLDLKFSVIRFLELTKFKLSEKFEQYVSLHGQPDEDLEGIRAFLSLIIIWCHSSWWFDLG